MSESVATYCSPCDAAVVAVPTLVPNLMTLMEFEADGFTPSDIPHICCPRDERQGRLIKARRQQA